MLQSWSAPTVVGRQEALGFEVVWEERAPPGAREELAQLEALALLVMRAVHALRLPMRVFGNRR
jgi:hypothetical protein